MKTSWFRDEQAPRAEHVQRMRRAAGIGSVTLICHEDTWEDIRQLSSTFLDTVVPQLVPPNRLKRRADHMVEACLSGSDVAELLNATHRRYFVTSPPHRAIAARVYQEVAKVVDAVDPDARPGQPLPPIVLDDKRGDQATAS